MLLPGLLVSVVIISKDWIFYRSWLSLLLRRLWHDNRPSLQYVSQQSVSPKQFYVQVRDVFRCRPLRSVTADVTESLQLETGRRNEGVISSTMTFASKCADALGTLLAGMLLALIAWLTETAVGDVPADTIFNLGLIYGPLVVVIYLCACFEA
jgi:hypothetical protein